jgi:gp16 family phage-associated protein
MSESTKPVRPCSRQDVKRELIKKGIPIATWAKENGINPTVAYALLNSKTKGNRGQAHQAAVLLGLKEGEIVQLVDVKHALAA